MGLAIIRIQKWQVPWDLTILKLKMASPMGLVLFEMIKWQIPWDLPLRITN